MNVDASNRVLIRRHSAFNTLQQPLFHYSPETGKIDPEPNIRLEASGWLIDFEKVIAGASRVIFFRHDGARYISLGNRVFEMGKKKSSVEHRRGVFVSELKIVDERGGEHTVKYVTPWWRLIFDDGSHPDLQFPLEAFSKQYANM
ncbi:hypothetical protein ACTJI2_12965 [Pseudoxanthomonas sp. 22568]|uniref:hypothetical protein n=1 Tax=Pseudoxanthomonas sp. 22568 TaxID=3453945 RepID=UPI003F857B16